MAWIEQVSPEEAQGALKRHYESAMKRAGKIFNIIRISSLSPSIIQQSIAFYSGLMLGPGELERRQREMIAVVVSRTNDCYY